MIEKSLHSEIAEFRVEMRAGFAELKELLSDLALRVGVVEAKDADVARKNGKSEG